MSDSSDPEPPEKRPLTDRTTVASKVTAQSSADQPSGEGIPQSAFESRAPHSKAKLEGDSPLIRLLPIVGIFFLFAILAGATLYLLNQPREAPQPAARETIETNDETLDAGPPPISLTLDNLATSAGRASDLARQNVSSMGGYDRLKANLSVLISGEALVDDSRYDFRLLARRPNYYRLTYQLGNDEERVFGYDGATAWTQHRKDGQVIQSKVMDGPSAGSLITMATFDQPPQALILAEEYPSEGENRGFEAEYLKQDLVTDRLCQVIEVTLPDGQRTTCFLEETTGLLLAMERQVDGKSFRIEYADYRLVDGVRVSFKQSHVVDGETRAVIQIMEARFNPGTMMSTFHPPAELR